MKVRWLALGLLVSGVYAVACSSDSKEGASPCNTVCNCVVRQAGEEARADCLSQCSGVSGMDDPVQECMDRLAANGISGCDAACFVFDDKTGGGTGGSANTGGADGDGGSDGDGGDGPLGGNPGAGGTAPPGGGSNAGGRTSTGGSSGAGGAAPVAGAPVGRACQTDANCGTGFTCILPTSDTLGGGSPSNGYCSADCTADPTICQNVDPNSVCVRFGTTAGTPAFCLEACVAGATQANKCHRRQDLACDDTGGAQPGDGFCRPTCRGDADCGARRCDLGSGLCVEEPLPSGALPIGSPCDPAAATETCAGFCVPLTDEPTGPGMCGALCTLGAPGCGATPSGPPPAAACLFALTSAEPTAGDLGLCGQLCNCDDECTADQRVCRPFDAADAQASGFAGYCGGATDANGATADHIACE